MGRKPKNDPTKLNRRQSLFVDEYLIDFNASRAARAIGSTDTQAGRHGYALVHHPLVEAEIARRGDLTADEAGLSRAYVLAKLKDNIEEAMRGSLVTNAFGVPLEDDKGQPIFVRESSFISAATRALELLAKLRGDLVERSEVKTLSVKIVLNDVNVEDLK